MKELKETKDFNGEIIKVGDEVIIGAEDKIGTITTIWNNKEVSIHHSNAHQGPVIDTFYIKHHKIFKIEDYE